MLTGDKASVEQKLIEDNESEEIIESVREVDEHLDKVMVDQIEKIADLVAAYLQGETESNERIREELYEVHQVWEEARDMFEKEVYHKVENTEDNNVGYAKSYMEDTITRIDRIRGYF